ncbi:MAG TPA: DUF2332 family protein, partial [Paracoccaceae bacterium]|nr:DUF2332 family protein [Paracoccaceae bacterium]
PGNPAGLAAALPAVLAARDGWFCNWVAQAPQTNEVGRAAVLIAAARMLAARFALPFVLSEPGASAGLNLRFDRFALAGEPHSTVRLAPDWTGPRPAPVPLHVIDRRGADLHPLNPAQDGDRLAAYVWPDQAGRLRRLEAALRIAAGLPAPVDCADAADWLEARLATPRPGACHLVFHTIAFQYFPPATQARATAALERAGATARPDAPLAWLAMEADGAPDGAAVTLRLWPGDLRLTLGRAGFHGQWLRWQAAAIG